MMDGLNEKDKKNNEAKPETSLMCFVINAFFFLIKNCRLHYLQCTQLHRFRCVIQEAANVASSRDEEQVW